MSKSYSGAELRKMQTEAEERVKEMQRRTVKAVDCISEEREEKGAKQSSLGLDNGSLLVLLLAALLFSQEGTQNKHENFMIYILLYILLDI